ncbi:hypothetical protein [Streptomyces vietnamensis]|uniref:hypothetical protein n=1 Tax=Streptomyces vietnamensis TaxID=362257 RepID=UPI000B13EF1A|nr:hypothetical protein [Streptomyces vietnamensis]
MRPPLTGDWSGLLAHAYRQLMEQTYARMPDGYVLPPELAPLGREHGPALARLVQRHLDRLAGRSPRSTHMDAHRTPGRAAPVL